MKFTNLIIGSIILLTTGVASATNYSFHRALPVGFSIAGSVEGGSSVPVSSVFGLNSAALPDATYGVPYSFDFKSLVSNDGAHVPLESEMTWWVAGSLPDGLSYDVSTGILSGTPVEQDADLGFSLEVWVYYTGPNGYQEVHQSYNLKVMGAIPKAAFSGLRIGDAETCGKLVSTGNWSCWSRGGTKLVEDLSMGTASSVSISRYHECKLSATGGVWCRGQNDSGQLGMGSTTAPNWGSWYGVTGLGSLNAATQVATSLYASCALLPSGAVKCWGSNTSGEAGVGYISGAVLTPTTVVGIPAMRKITGGGNSFCGISTDNRVFCWGQQMGGQFGNGRTYSGYYIPAGNYSAAEPTPVENTSFGQVSDLAMGGDHICALKGSDLYCIGQNYYGQVGLSDDSMRDDILLATKVMSNVSQFTLGNLHTCAVSSGKVYCWGENSTSQLGRGFTGDALEYSSVPTIVPGTDDLTAIFSNDSYATCGLNSSGFMKCWGESDNVMRYNNALKPVYIYDVH